MSSDGEGYGDFTGLCRNTGSDHSTLPPCYLFRQAIQRGGPGYGGCELRGINVGGGDRLANLGSILFAFLGILAAAFLFLRSERKKAAVGRREMQFFLVGYIIISICEIFTIGGFPLSSPVRRAFVAVHIASIIATTWILMMNGAVGYQLLDDGTLLSLALIFGSAAALFVGTGYIALDIGFSWTNYFNTDVLQLAPQNQAYALFTLYQIAPLFFLVVFFILETVLVLRVLGENRPMIYLIGAALLFAIGQIFQYVVSRFICNGTNGAINGGMFATLFTLLSVVMVWMFWSSITEDDWPMPGAGGSTYT